MDRSIPLFSICIPAYNRPQWFKRALESIIVTNTSCEKDLEIIISDDSSTDSCRSIAEEVLANWKGSWKYVFNQPKLGMATNWNQAIKLASGEYILVLHDDDFLIDRAVENIIKCIKKYRELYLVLLFGVRVVDEGERVLKKQIFTREFYLFPKQALQQLMSNSSFVRFPAIVIHRQIFEEVGYFDPSVGGIADIKMWIQLFGKFGVMCLPITTCAYRVHSEALTMGMFNIEVIEKLLILFDRVNDLKILDSDTFAQCQSNFFHQFILAGTFRALRRGKLDTANQILNLFEINSLKKLPISFKWLLIRTIFTIFFSIYSLFIAFQIK